jgi:hypothetical protein
MCENSDNGMGRHVKMSSSTTMARGRAALTLLVLVVSVSALVTPKPFTARRALPVTIRTAATVLEPPTASIASIAPSLDDAVDESGQRWESPLEATVVAENLSFAQKMEVCALPPLVPRVVGQAPMR